MTPDQPGRQPASEGSLRGVAAESTTMGLYVAIVLLSILVGFGGEGTRAEEVRLLWGTAVGLGLAHFFAIRLAAILRRADPRPTRHDAEAGAGLVIGLGSVAGVASIPYLLGISTLDASTVASVLLLLVIGGTGFASVRRAGRGRVRAVVFSLVVVSVAAVVVAIKYSLTH